MGNLLSDLVDRLPVRLHHDGVIGPAEGRGVAAGVCRIPAAKLRKDIVHGDVEAATDELPVATAGALLVGGVEVDLHPGVRDDHSRDVAPDHHDPAPTGDPALDREEHVADDRMSRDGGHVPVDLRRPEQRGDVLTIDQDIARPTIVGGGRFDRDVAGAEEGGDGRAIGRVDPGPQRPEGGRAVE